MLRLLIIFLLAFTSTSRAQHIYEHKKDSYRLIGEGLSNAAFFQDNKMNYYDIKYLKLDVTVQPKSTFIKAACTYKVEVKQPLDTFVIEFKQTMELDSVYLNNVKTAFVRGSDHIYVPLIPILNTGSILTISFFYKGNVAAGFFAGTDANGLDFTASVSEPFKAREWFPAKQLLNAKIDSTDIWITTGTAYKAGSNGLLKAVIDLPDNLKQFRWSCGYPLNYYMPCVAVGNYLEYNNYAKPASIAPDSILVQNLVYNDSTFFNQNKSKLDKTPLFIGKMSELFGIYPFYKEKYGHSQADIGGGMEHATMTTLKNFDEQLVAHELAHQWFGDNVTCASWNDIWVNESFATYCQYLMTEKLPALFSETAAQTMNEFHNNVLSSPGGSVYISPSDSYNESRIFNYRLSYAKGATALHNLRFEMQNDSLFFRIVRQYQLQYANSFATTDDFKIVAEKESGKNLANFFNQKIYGEGYPAYNLTYLKHGSDSLVLQIDQIASVPAVTPFFSGLMEYKILSPQGDTTIQLDQTTNDQTFTLHYSKTPTGVVVDPNNWVLNGIGTIKEGISTVPPLVDHITVFPNPVRNHISIKLPATAYQSIKLIDVEGRVLANEFILPGANLFTKDLHLPPGMYFIYFYGNAVSAVRKIIVTR